MNSAIRCTPSSLSSNFSALPSRRLSVLNTQSFHSLPTRENVSVSCQKPLYVSCNESFSLVEEKRKRGVKCEAYEADKSRPLEIGVDEEDGVQAAQKLKISLYFATWWALNVVFNIYNKKVLNAFPYPWLTSTLSLAAGSLMMLISWATRIAETPKVNFDFWKALFPVSKPCSILSTSSLP